MAALRHSGANCSPISGATTDHLPARSRRRLHDRGRRHRQQHAPAPPAASTNPTAVVPPRHRRRSNSSPPTISGTATAGQNIDGLTGQLDRVAGTDVHVSVAALRQSGANCNPISGATDHLPARHRPTSAPRSWSASPPATRAGTAGPRQHPTASSPPPRSRRSKAQPPTITRHTGRGQTLTAITGQLDRVTRHRRLRISGSAATPAAPTAARSAARPPPPTLVTSRRRLHDRGQRHRQQHRRHRPAASSPDQRVVAPPLAPTTPVLDNFNRANGGAGANWSLIRPSGFAAMNVSGNAAVDSSSSLVRLELLEAANFGPDSEAYVTIATTGRRRRSGSAPASQCRRQHILGLLRLRSAHRGLVDHPHRQRRHPGHPRLRRHTTARRGDKIAIRIVGSTVRALHYTPTGGWAQVLTYNTASDTIRYTTAGRVALEFRAGAFDDFGGGSI